MINNDEIEYSICPECGGTVIKKDEKYYHCEDCGKVLILIDGELNEKEEE